MNLGQHFARFKSFKLLAHVLQVKTSFFNLFKSIVLKIAHSNALQRIATLIILDTLAPFLTAFLKLMLDHPMLAKQVFDLFCEIQMIQTVCKVWVVLSLLNRLVLFQ
jgi:hypothetical protein